LFSIRNDHPLESSIIVTSSITGQSGGKKKGGEGGKKRLERVNSLEQLLEGVIRFCRFKDPISSWISFGGEGGEEEERSLCGRTYLNQVFGTSGDVTSMKLAESAKKGREGEREKEKKGGVAITDSIFNSPLNPWIGSTRPDCGVRRKKKLHEEEKGKGKGGERALHAWAVTAHKRSVEANSRKAA